MKCILDKKCLICGKIVQDSSTKRPWEFICSDCSTKKVNTKPQGSALLGALKREDNYTLTENLAVTHKSTLNKLLDFFALGGALRSRTADEIIDLFDKAWSENPLLAWKCAFYFRDIRGGQGERQTFRTILHYMGEAHPEVVKKNLANIAFFGRWDDLYVLVGTRSEQAMWEFMNNQFQLDMVSQTPTLLGKWLKSENTSSKISRALGKATRNAFGLTSKSYRKALALLRTKINIVEKKMCSNNWGSIKYDQVPSRASMIYRNAFRKHDADRYQAFLDAVEKGEVEIKTATLYPYDVIRAIDQIGKNDQTLSLQWDNLPDYTNGGEESAIVVADTSGSMFGDRWAGRTRTVAPIYVSVSLAMYFAERAKGPFQGHFITFSGKPALQEVIGDNIWRRWKNLSRADWQGNTNLQAVFDLILRTAVQNRLPQEEMVKKIYIISDMEFDSCVTWGSGYGYRYSKPQLTNFHAIAAKYKSAGYDLPTLVFWNVDARNNQSPITIDDKGVFLVSGLSPSIFQHLMNSQCLDAVGMMLEVLNKERYNQITI